MPTKSYRFYDPSHQASFQQVLQSSHRQSTTREEFEDAQRGNDMAHITPHKNWIQYDLTDAVPSTRRAEAGTPINLYIRSSDSWLPCGAALLTVHSNAQNRSSNQAWVTLHSHGSGRLAGVFSVFSGMQLIRFNESVLCATIQSSPPRFVTYGFQCETIDQASDLRHTLASAASAATASGNGHATTPPPISPELIEGSMERRLSSWIHAVEEQLVPFQPSPSSFDSDSVSVSRASIRSGSASEIAVFGRLKQRQRRGGIDLGDSYWDLEKSRALQEARTELDSLQLKRLLSGFEL